MIIVTCTNAQEVISDGTITLECDMKAPPNIEAPQRDDIDTVLINIDILNNDTMDGVKVHWRGQDWEIQCGSMIANDEKALINVAEI